MIDLKSLHNILNWHEKRDVPFGEKVGLFIPVPDFIAKQFPPEGKMGEDSSPPHITLIYIGALPRGFEERLDQVVKAICDEFRCFKVKLGKVKKFINNEGQKVYHSPIKSKKLYLLHETCKKVFQRAQIPFSTKYPEYKPHITIEYVNPGEKQRFNVCPKGEWEVDSIWVWGTQEPKWYFLK